MSRAGALLTATALATAGTVVVGTTAAHASDTFTYRYGTDYIMIYRNGTYSGEAEWVPDPTEDSTGDTLYGYDPTADGWGVVAHLSTGRTASTLGHASPYLARTPGNLPEDHTYDMWLVFKKGTQSVTSPRLKVTS